MSAQSATGWSSPEHSSLATAGGQGSFGPLAGVHWPAGAIRSGMLLHDDGTTLWRVPLRGDPEPLWRHPHRRVYEMSAAPEGPGLAYILFLGPPGSPDDAVMVLYWLRGDGTIQTVDVSRDYHSLGSATFVRAPTDPLGPIRLYWLRTGDKVDEATGRLDQRVMVLGPNGPEPVRVPLRYEEAPFEVSAYPGAATFSLLVFRTNDIPTRFQLLVNLDRYRNATSAALELWANNEPRIDTDLTGVAWISPTEYVVTVAKDDYPARYSLRLFVWGCEWMGSNIVYEGKAIDWAYTENPWPLLPAGRKRLLILGSADMKRVGGHVTEQIPWRTVDIETGRIRVTDAMWTPERDIGWWTYVQPDLGPGVPVRENQYPDCSKWNFTYP